MKIRHAKRGNYSELDLSNEDLNEIPEEIFTLPNLEKLDISDNKLSELRGIDRLPKLKVLIAKNNGISALQSAILKLKNLNSLDITGNPLSHSNPELSKLSSPSLKPKLEAYFSTSTEESKDTSQKLPSAFSTNLNDPVHLRKVIQELQTELDSLKLSHAEKPS